MIGQGHEHGVAAHQVDPLECLGICEGIFGDSLDRDCAVRLHRDELATLAQGHTAQATVHHEKCRTRGRRAYFQQDPVR